MPPLAMGEEELRRLVAITAEAIEVAARVGVPAGV
jgi:hypothetical protein